MIRITLEHFRCWPQLTLEIPIGSVTLMKGMSGAGKTTILQAITWCLFGNIRLVAPLTNAKAKTQVTIEFPHQGKFSVMRRRNPNRLIVTHNGVEQEDDVAQAAITAIFGSYEVWMASCYVEQKSLNSFLTAPNAGKMELLNSIAFNEEDPSHYIDKIDSNIAEADAKYKAELAQFNLEVEALNKGLSTIDLNQLLTKEQEVQLHSDIIAKQEHIMTLLDAQTRRVQILNMIATLEKQLKQIEGKVVCLPLVPVLLSHDLSNWQLKVDEEALQTLRDILPYIKRRDDLANELSKITVVEPSVPCPVVSEEAYSEAVRLEQQVDLQRAEAKFFNIKYDRTEIDNLIKRLTTILNDQPKVRLQVEYRALAEEIELIQRKPDPPSVVYSTITPTAIAPAIIIDTSELHKQVKDLSELRNTKQAELFQLQKNLDVLQCPACSSNLRCVNGVLCSADSPCSKDDLPRCQAELTEITAKITALEKEITLSETRNKHEQARYDGEVRAEEMRVTALRNHNHKLELHQLSIDMAKAEKERVIKGLQDKRSALLQEHPDIEQKIASQYLIQPEEARQRSYLARMMNIQVLPEVSPSSSLIRAHIVYQRAKEQQDKLRQEYDQVGSSIPKCYFSAGVDRIKNTINDLTSYLSYTASAKLEQAKIETQKQTVQQQITDARASLLPDMEQEIHRCTKEKDIMTDRIAINNRTKEVMQFHAQVSTKREIIVTLNRKLYDLQRLRQSAVETECHILQSAVDNINNCIADVCSSLFERDISITLNLFKTLKSNKNVKPIVNFSVSYGGGEFDNITQLSGGEKDRASLALTLALSRLSSSPLLILDETFASLDNNTKDTAIETIRSNTNCSVLIVMQDGVEGIYDHVIDVDSFNK
jgi:DNA repair exonuclease SbcCD ATPase subunit